MFIMCALKTGLPNGSQCVYHEHTEKRVCQRAASAFYHEGTEKWVNRALSVQVPSAALGVLPNMLLSWSKIAVLSGAGAGNVLARLRVSRAIQCIY